MIKSDQINEVAAALCKVQAALKPAIKDTVNPAFKKPDGSKTMYADLGAVWDAARDLLASNGLSVTQLPTEAPEGHLGLTTLLMHSNGQYIGSTLVMRLAKNDPQGAGSAITYGRRYALAALLGVVADEDDDGNYASGVRSSNGQAANNGNEQPQPPRTPTEARTRFYNRFVGDIGGDRWPNLHRFLGSRSPGREPTTVDGWLALGNLMLEILNEQQAA